MRHTRLICLFIMMMLSASSSLIAAVTVTAATGGTCLNISPGAYTTLGNIVITEGATTDFSSPQTNTTLILSAPSGFEFQNATGSVSYQAGRNITAASIAVTTTTITVTISVSNTHRSDRLTISGINVRSLAVGNTGSIYRTGGTATIAGNAVSDNINHGSLTSIGTGFLVTSVADGNWSSPSTWSTGTVPSCGEDILISNSVTADMAVTVPNLTIATGGNLTTNSAVTISSTFTISGTGTYTHNNTGNATSTIFAGAESFSSTSNIVINQWYNFNIPLANPITGNFGNITFNAAGTWQQNGKFSPAKIQGDINITAGTVVMDNGTGTTTSLTLNNVTISGSGNLIFASGSNRNLTLNTGNFTDNGNDGTQSAIVDGSTGTIDWNVTGDVILNDNFNIIDAAGTSTVTLDVTGDLDITGGAIDFINSTSATFNYNVTGNTTVSGTPTRVTFVNSGSGTITINTGGLIFNGGTSNEILSGSFSGNNQINTTGNLEVNGATTTLYIVNITGYSPTLNVNIGNDILVTNGDLYFAESSGATDITCGRHMTITGSTSLVTGQLKTSNTGLCDFTVNGTFTVGNAATFYQSHGEGNITMTVGETLAISNGYYFGINHTVGPAAPTATYTFQDFDFNGGTTSFFDVKTSANTTVVVNCTNNFSANWLASTDWIELVSYDGNNDASLTLNIGGDFTITGNYDDAYFLSSQAGGTETINITGSFSVSGGTVMFVCDISNTSGVDAHNITTTISGDMNISGGKTYLSARDGLATINLAGDLNISGGILNLKWLSGTSTMTVSGDYNHTSGTFNLHSHTTAITDTCKVIVSGNFTQTGGTLNFDNAASSADAEHKLYINGPSVTLGGTGVWTHANNGTNNPIFGQVYYNSGTTTTYERSSSTHEIQHVKQTINSGTTVDASASTNGFRMTSNQSSNANTHTALYIYGTLDMGAGQITSRQTTNYYSRMIMYDNSRLRLSHTGGLYSGSATASTLDGMIVGNNRANYYLYPSSIVEYYGTSTMIVTGIPNGIATTNNHKYGILEINHTGTAGSAWVYPEADGEVFIRTELRLSAGEFNLDTDHTTSGGGHTVNVEAGGTITRTTGFIRSETEDGSADLRWYITANGSYTIPFGYDASEYIPFTYQQTSGSTGELLAATYRTASDNTPYPPTVSHVNDVYGVNNSAYTVDRFWKIQVTGTANSGLTFTYTNSEGSTIVSPRAQLWEPVSSGWFPPSASQSNPTSNSTSAGGITAFNTWWTLSAASSPLPIQLISYEAKIKGTYVSNEWVTGTELNNDYFTVERSSDGVNFENIGTVDGAGTSSSPLAYQFIDKKPLQGTAYYRLKQTDFDGRFTYSQVRTITFTAKPNGISVYPNPATAGSTTTLVMPEAGLYTVTIMSASGQITNVYQGETTDKGTLTIPAPDSKGIYLIHAESAEQVYRQKLIISE